MHGITAPLQHVHLVGWLWIIPLLPLLGSCTNAFFGKRIQERIGKKGVAAVAITPMAIAFALAVTAFVTLIGLPESDRYLLNQCWTMIRIGSLDVNFSFGIDPLSSMMILIITGIGSLIHVYASSYMESEPSYWRFFCYLNLFVFSMLLLVMGDNFFIMFFGWEGVGLCSYLLIGFWWKDYRKASAGMKAFVTNRVGDWGFVVGMMLLFWSLGGFWAKKDGEYERHNPAPAYASMEDLEVESSQPNVGSALHPVLVTEMPKEEEGEAKEGAKEGEHAEKGEEKAEAKAPTGKAYLTMTAFPGARVWIGTNADKVLTSPFVHEDVGAPGPKAVTIDLGLAGQSPVRFTNVDFVDGAEIAFAPVGPTVSFRQLRDELTLTDSAHHHFVGDSLDPHSVDSRGHPRHKTVWGISVLTLACICFFIGACGKSAQIPLYVWLPDAMAGPTPVSALIHAATMVTAGVYMIARLSFLFALSPTACAVVASVGALTALFAATIGFFQMDIKKVLAYSTVSQLGFMFIGVGVGAYWAGVFHLMTHAFFKACLFLASGSVIHGMHAVEHDEVASQDMRKMGGLKKVMPHTARTYFIACLAITAAPIPLFAGFWSKDEILWKAFSTENLCLPWLGRVIYFVGLAAAMGTSFYMWRSYYLTFEGQPKKREVLEKVHESPARMTYVLWVLAILSTCAGVLFGLSKHFFGLGLGPAEPILEKWLHPVIDVAGIHGREVLKFAENGTAEKLLMVLSVGLAIGSWFIAKTLYGAGRSERWEANESRVPAYSLTQNKYYVDEIYQATVIRWVLRLRMLLSGMDRYVVDGLVNFSSVAMRTVSWINGKIDYYLVDGAVRGVSEGLLVVGQRARKLQTGRIQNYVLAALGGVAVFALIVQLFR